MAIIRDLNHTTRDINTLNDLDALYQAAVTLITAKKRSKPFAPEYGSDLDKYLFEPCTEDTALKIKYEIDALFSQDTRFKLNYSGSSVIPDPINSQFKLNLKLVFPSLGQAEYPLSLALKQQKAGY